MKLSVTDAELAVLRTIWQRGTATARQITASIYPDGGDAEFASVHSFLQRLERKGFVQRDRSEFVHRFTATVTQTDIAGQEFEALAERLTDGSLLPFLMYLAQERRLTDEEAKEIRAMLNGYRTQRGR
jgi:BlaI family penicillinase repressor